MLKALALLLLVPMDVVRPLAAEDPWVTTTTVALFVGSHAETLYTHSWNGLEAGAIKMPGKLSNWTCKRGGADRGEDLTSYVECRAKDATVVVDVTCKKGEADADIGAVILLNKARNYGGRFVVTCMTAADVEDHDEPEEG